MPDTRARPRAANQRQSDVVTGSTPRPRTRTRRARPPIDGEDYATFAERIVRRFGARAGEDIVVLGFLARLERLINEQMTAAARRLHDVEGHSWSQIGDELGITRQAARQRFAHEEAS